MKPQRRIRTKRAHLLEPLSERALFSVFNLNWSLLLHNPSELESITLEVYDQDTGILEVAFAFNGGTEFLLIPRLDSSRPRQPYNVIQPDGQEGHETITFDFSYGAFSLTPNNPLFQITGSDPALQDTLVLRDTNGNDSISQFPSGDPAFPNAILFTDLDTNSSTTIEYAGGITDLVIESPEPSSLTVLAAAPLILLTRERQRDVRRFTHAALHGATG